MLCHLSRDEGEYLIVIALIESKLVAIHTLDFYGVSLVGKETEDVDIRMEMIRQVQKWVKGKKGCERQLGRQL